MTRSQLAEQQDMAELLRLFPDPAAVQQRLTRLVREEVLLRKLLRLSLHVRDLEADARPAPRRRVAAAD